MNLSKDDLQKFINLFKQLVSQVKNECINPFQKLNKMQEIYLLKYPNRYPLHRRNDINKSLKAIHQKFLIANTHLEELWTLSMASRWNLLELVESSVRKHEWSDEEMLLGVLELEAFLFQSRSFLDFFMAHICLLLNTPYPIYMSQENFNKFLSNVKEEPLRQKAENTRIYFDSNVFGEKCWGALLVSLRDKIAHYTSLHPQRDGTESVLCMHLDWPTIRKLTFERFVQDFHNGMFNLISDVSPILYELDWKSCPYRADLWN